MGQFFAWKTQRENVDRAVRQADEAKALVTNLEASLIAKENTIARLHKDAEADRFARMQKDTLIHSLQSHFEARSRRFELHNSGTSIARGVAVKMHHSNKIFSPIIDLIEKETSEFTVSVFDETPCWVSSSDLGSVIQHYGESMSFEGWQRAVIDVEYSDGKGKDFITSWEVELNNPEEACRITIRPSPLG